MTRILPLALVASLVAHAAVAQPAQSGLPKPVNDAAAALPLDLRDAAQRVLAASAFTTDAADSAVIALRALTGREESREFLLLMLVDQKQSAAKRLRIMQSVSYGKIVTHPMGVAVLGRIVASDTSAALRRLANEVLHRVTVRLQRADLAITIDSVRRSGDAARLDSLFTQDEDLMLEMQHVALPQWLRRPPATPIVVKPATQQNLRLLVMGDFGASRGVETQVEVAHAIQSVHAQKPFEVALTLGDNFYGYGLDDPANPRWKTQWEDLYTPLGIRFYASLGNHDWNGSSPASEITYSGRSKSWQLPAPYYTWTAGPVQFFAIETDMLSDGAARQRDWLEKEIAKSTATWKVVYGHFPMRTQVERDGKSVVVADEGMQKYLLPLLEKKVDIYFAGHHHSQQHHQPINGVEQFICGSSGYKIYPVGPGLDPTVRFAKAVMGFVAVDVTPKTFKVTYYDNKAAQIYTYTAKK